ncbi:MAG: IS21 family transposase, partial [Methanosarcinaceae archaeon]|nr:IS21 family transposase [Methanosarcinaceae archaeon]
MEDWITIRNLKKRNPKMGTRKIAKKLDLSRNTVRNALRSEDPPAYKRQPYTNSELQPFQEYII